MFDRNGSEKQKRMPGGIKYHWTQHVQRKLQFYGLTPSRILRVISAPDRMEEGIVEGTLAAMQTAGTKARPWEVWVMWREGKVKVASPQLSVASSELKTGNSKLETYFSGRKVIITAWRYPGVSPVRERIPIPAGLIAELESEGVI